uniref:U-box domain-containing protein n=1 Tax=Opuntia streptacantha TaxID=393608 RepID=A0A7C9EZN8_OPUST
MNPIEQQDDIEVPPYFLCPISLQMMKDPVTVSTGITYERENIEKWVFTNKNTTCPVTKQGLNMEMFTPNHTLRRLIQSWCTLHASVGIERFPTPKAPATQAQVLKLIREADRPNSNAQTKVKCLRKLRSMASYSSANRRCLESAGAVEFLSRVIVQDSVSLDQDMSVSDEALSILSQLKISDEERLRKLVVDTEGALFDSLTRVMSRSNFECRAHAVELMKSMMQVVDPAQAASIKLDHLTEVVQIIKDPVSPRATKAALKVLALACPWGRNRVRAVEAGAVPVLIELLVDAPAQDKRSNEMALAVLDQLCGCAEGRSELLAPGAGLAVISKKILRVSHFASERGVRILASIAKFSASPAVLQEMMQLGVVTKLCLVLQVDGDAKTKERAREMLKVHARAWKNSPCAPHLVLSSFS